MFRITFSMLNDSLDSVIDGDLELSEDVVSRDAEVDRFYWLLSKQYNLMLKKPRYLQDDPNVEESLNFFLVGRILERVADHAKNISDHNLTIKTARKGPRLPKDTLKFVSESGDVALDMLTNAFNAFIQGDTPLANRTIDRTEELSELTDNGITTISSGKSGLAVAIAGMMDSVKRTGMYASDIAEIAINNQVVIFS